MDLKSLVDQEVVRLRAIDRARNINRRYEIVQQADLFGHIIVDWHWGRVGAVGQSRTLSFAAASDARAFVKQLLARRTSAPKRIGVAYQPVSEEPANFMP